MIFFWACISYLRMHVITCNAFDVRATSREQHPTYDIRITTFLKNALSTNLNKTSQIKWLKITDEAQLSNVADYEITSSAEQWSRFWATWTCHPACTRAESFLILSKSLEHWKPVYKINHEIERKRFQGWAQAKDIQKVGKLRCKFIETTWFGNTLFWGPSSSENYWRGHFLK